MYVDLAGFTTYLTDNITARTRHIPIPWEDYDFLVENLADGDYTYLEIRDGNAIEYIKVANECDTIVIDRGVEKTRAYAFRCGTGVTFQLTRRGVEDTICQMENCE